MSKINRMYFEINVKNQWTEFYNAFKLNSLNVLYNVSN